MCCPEPSAVVALQAWKVAWESRTLSRSPLQRVTRLPTLLQWPAGSTLWLCVWTTPWWPWRGCWGQRALPCPRPRAFKRYSCMRDAACHYLVITWRVFPSLSFPPPADQAQVDANLLCPDGPPEHVHRCDAASECRCLFLCYCFVLPAYIPTPPFSGLLWAVSRLRPCVCVFTSRMRCAILCQKSWCACAHASFCAGLLNLNVLSVCYERHSR